MSSELPVFHVIVPIPSIFWSPLISRSCRCRSDLRTCWFPTFTSIMASGSNYPHGQNNNQSTGNANNVPDWHMSSPGPSSPQRGQLSSAVSASPGETLLKINATVQKLEREIGNMEDKHNEVCHNLSALMDSLNSYLIEINSKTDKSKREYRSMSQDIHSIKSGIDGLSGLMQRLVEVQEEQLRQLNHLVQRARGPQSTSPGLYSGPGSPGPGQAGPNSMGRYSRN
ncbi:uncharacterized protein EV420DRAFT_1655272 [Desarmillaria tabescens]|uniref:Uncharacterized protein n=1 Tax=Armillaria tabescens TaxID=1929756 RepID=A0AA39J0V9_ARMTA|nr:uncharacterized protein EV420DRAFT_1655272 [Desarmillaria tabescens]KAK0432744.1 hypothetical protein EV420DRAFT_1655272 [Desarmillaria tabescens]